MTIGNIIALVIGIISGILCLALAVFGLAVFIAVLREAKDTVDEFWKQDN